MDRLKTYERPHPNSTCPGCRERFYAYPEVDDCDMHCQSCGAEFTYAEGRRGQFFVKADRTEQRIAMLERQLADVQSTLIDLVDGKIRMREAVA